MSTTNIAEHVDFEHLLMGILKKLEKNGQLEGMCETKEQKEDLIKSLTDAIPGYEKGLKVSLDDLKKKPEILLTLSIKLITEAVKQKHDPENKGLKKPADGQQDKIKEELKKEIESLLLNFNPPITTIPDKDLEKIVIKITDEDVYEKSPELKPRPELEQDEEQDDELDQDQDQNKNKNTIPGDMPSMDTGVVALVDNEGNKLATVAPSNGASKLCQAISVAALGATGGVAEENLVERGTLGDDFDTEAPTPSHRNTPYPTRPKGPLG